VTPDVDVVIAAFRRDHPHHEVALTRLTQDLALIAIRVAAPARTV